MKTFVFLSFISTSILTPNFAHSSLLNANDCIIDSEQLDRSQRADSTFIFELLKSNPNCKTTHFTINDGPYPTPTTKTIEVIPYMYIWSNPHQSGSALKICTKELEQKTIPLPIESNGASSHFKINCNI